LIATFREIAPACFFHRGIASPRPSNFFPKDKLFTSLIVDNPGYQIWSELIERVATMGNGALVSKDGDGSSAKCQFPREPSGLSTLPTVQCSAWSFVTEFVCV
jgi:hypothetical protein